ncbi:sugar transferase [Spirulina sp. CS-785/01]|uniref:sugar transferase n=1 Tax=Spirulina sp. CS-785/01 TaxID=3021716 RepID=UPI00232D6DA7|nr:sugar transferase [Spirulina sp. CS-785/01]MDB9312556.1 sugar transferase [Spirulina sp. CS-785/01]
MSSFSSVSYFTPHPSVHSPLKRLLDILGSLLGLFLLGLIFLPVAIAIKLDSPGPIFFRQQRYGLYGQPFQLYKFRSMVSNAEALRRGYPTHTTGFLFKDAGDPRITRVGHWLRRTSLDEFPQFWNVLKGEMSLVGTRPPIGEEVVQYTSYQWQRLNVKPGLTGEWQVNGRSQVKNFEKIVALDLRYQNRWTVGYDCRILLKTLWVVLGQVGAF